jgi:hypothetical protein
MDSAQLPEGISRYNSLQIKGTKRFSTGLSMLAFLTWSKSLTNSAVTGQVQYPPDRTVTLDPSVVPLVFSSSWTYELPFGTGRKFLGSSSPFVSRLVSGWRVNGFVRYTSGSALLITSANNLAPLGYTGKLADRVAGQSIHDASNPRDFNPFTDRYLNRDAFAAPAAFSLGNTNGYLGYARGFTQKSESLSIGKTTKVSESTTFELSADITNPFNFVRWSDPSGGALNITSGSFGSVTSSQPSRSIQINGSFTF